MHLRATGRPGLILLALLLGACAGGSRVSPPPGPPAPGPSPAGTDEAFHAAFKRGLEVAEGWRSPAITERRFSQAQLWIALQPMLTGGIFTVEEVGRSLQGRPITTIVWGEGPARVLLWSQMHGDESCATMALVDLVRWLADPTPDPLREVLRAGTTLILLPMLNPDGAEIWQRENALGIDINRDARRLATPEARTLRSVWEKWHPDFGFNLHDQDPRTSAGRQGNRAGIALLAPAADPQRSWGAGRARARQVAAVLATVLEREIPGRVARYGDAFNPRAFGDLMQQWGTSTVLIESGVLPDDPAKQRLRAVNLGALAAALDAIATGSWAVADPGAYERLPDNSGNSYDLVVRGGTLVLPGLEPVPVDLAFAFEDGVGRKGLTLLAAGDLEEVWAHEEFDARGLYLHPGPGMLTWAGSVCWLRLGSSADLDLRSAPEFRGPIVVRIDGYGVRRIR
jgi:hypothetical protein